MLIAVAVACLLIYCYHGHMSAQPTIPATLPDVPILAYTAGLLDGEGSIQINGAKNGTEGGRSYWTLSVQICSVGEDFLEGVRARWHNIGAITYSKSRGSRAGRTIRNWRLYSAQAEWFLAAILPYLRLKQEQARIALEFRQYVAPRKNWLTPERLEQRERLALEMRALNARTGKGLGARKSVGVF